VRNKEMQVRGINQAKSREIHQSNYNNLVNKINASSNEEVIENYCKSALDDQKTDVLLENLERAMMIHASQMARQTAKAKGAAQPVSSEMVAISEKIKEVERQIAEKTDIMG
jgi:ribosomal protein L12E/L44/L45/RPP1/RPP2